MIPSSYPLYILSLIGAVSAALTLDVNDPRTISPHQPPPLLSSSSPITCPHLGCGRHMLTPTCRPRRVHQRQCGSSSLRPHECLLRGQPDGQDPRHPARTPTGRRLLLVAGRRIMGHARRLLALHGRHVLRRDDQAGAAVPDGARQQLHGPQLDRLAGQRRPGLLGPQLHARRRERLPGSAGRRQTPVARAHAGRLQHPGPSRSPRRDVQRWAAVADPTQQ